VVTSRRGIRALFLPEASAAAVAARVRDLCGAVPEDGRGLAATCRRLRDYFAGRRVAFPEALDLAACGDFDRRVWRAARRIRYGEVVTYGTLAARCGARRAARAVGGALGRNPVPLIVPCHRVVRADGSPGGFSGPGGASLKARMLALEGGCAGRSRCVHSPARDLTPRRKNDGA
jgi:methylated-DNA-[protein]-cysteine S-methyltransferase